MKNESRNPFWVHAKLEESYYKQRSYSCLNNSECEIIIRPERNYFEQNGEEHFTHDVGIYIGNRISTVNTELVLSKKEAKEFANLILNFVDVLEKDDDAR